MVRIDELFEEKLVFEIAGTKFFALRMLEQRTSLKESPAIAQGMHARRVGRLLLVTGHGTCLAGAVVVRPGDHI